MRRPEHFYRLTAEQLGKSVDLVTQVNKFYWRWIKNLIRKGEEPVIFIRGLGTLFAAPKKTNREILRKIYSIRAARENKVWTPERKQQIIATLIKDLQDLLKLRKKSIKQRAVINNRKRQMIEQDEQAA